MTSRIYSPPWREIQKDGTLGPGYGPKTAATYARHCANFQDWSFRPSAAPPADAETVQAYMKAEGEKASEREREVFVCTYLSGMGLKLTADELGVSRSSVKSYRARLREKARRWRKGLKDG